MIEPRPPGPPDAQVARAMPRFGRGGVFSVVLCVCVAGAVGYAGHAAWRAKAAAAGRPQAPVVAIAALPAAAAASAAALAVPATALPADAAQPYLLFRSTALGEQYGRVSLEYLDAPAGPRLSTPLQCDRVHFAAGRGICLEARRGVLTTYHAHIFDSDLKIIHSVELAGTPSRARVSRDGRLAAMTVFVSGHGYGSPGFVTRTSVLDTARGQWRAADLEKFEVTRDGAPFKAVDFNFWGVTFMRDSQRFYATLGTAGKTFLVEGNLATRQMRVVRDDVECPSLSPDNRRIAFKRRVATGNAGRVVWQLQVLDLTSGKETALSAETHNVDDQVEWLGNSEIVYALPADERQSSAATNTWALPVDGSGLPRLLVPFAFSPAVVQ